MQCRRWFPLVLVTAIAWGAASSAPAATFTVTTTTDAGAGSLRNAVALANAGAGGDTIIVPASPVAYILTSGELLLTKPVSILGGGVGVTTVSGNSTSRIFNFTAGSATGPNVVAGFSLTAGRATASGGAILSSGGTLTLASVAMTENTAVGRGGAVAIGGNGSSSDLLTISESTFTRNTSSSYGGAVAAGGGGSSADKVTITASLFAGNTAGTDRDGGAISTGGGGGNTDVTTINDTTIVSNIVPGTSGSGGGVDLGGATNRLADDTIDDNTAAYGGGISGPASAVLVNTIVAGNHAGSAAVADCRIPVTSGGHNLEGGTGCGFSGAGDLRTSAPLLGALRDNGGPTGTQMLQPGSPAVDAGSGAVGPPADQRGVQRPQGAANDIGAVEVAAPSAMTGATTDVTATTATAHGVATNPGPAATTVAFQYGASAAYGAQTTPQAVGPNTGSQAVSAALTGLPAGTVVHVRVVAASPDGTSYGADQTFTTAALPAGAIPIPAGPSAPRPADVGPSLTDLRLHPSRFHAATHGASVATIRRARGTTISYRDSQPAITTFTVQRIRKGYRLSGRCLLKRPRHVRRSTSRCTSYSTSGAFRHTDVAGVNRLGFTGRIAGKRLPAGRYRLSATPRSRAGRQGATVRKTLTVVAAKH